MLSVRNLSAVLSSGFRLDEVSLEVGSDDRLAVLGPSGAGKSFLLRLILGLETPRSGEIAWEGKPLSEAGRVVVPPEARAMGVVFQEGALFPHLDVRRNVALGLPRKGGDDRSGQVDRALELARIRPLQRRSVQSLSGGELQRVAIARALVRHPRILLLDEPFHSLDGPLKREVLADVRALVKGERIATVLVTHDTDEAAAFADRVVLLRDGRVVQTGTFEEVYAQPVDREAADFLGPVESLEPSRARASSIELPDRSEGTICFRREHVEIVELGEEETDGLEVTDVQAHGAFQDVSMRLEGGGEFVARAPEGPPWRVGQRVRARITRAFAFAEAERR